VFVLFILDCVDNDNDDDDDDYDGDGYDRMTSR
jgi:hypothetical protein